MCMCTKPSRPESSMVMEDVLVDRCAATSLGPCDSNELQGTQTSGSHVLLPQWEICCGGTKQECKLGTLQATD